VKFLSILDIVLVVLVCACSKTENVYYYQTSVAPASTLDYVGCYSDTSTRALPDFLLQSGATVESCIALAKASGYKYAGVQYGVQCFAGNTMGYTELPASSCNMPCTADPNEICGGTWSNSIYGTGL